MSRPADELLYDSEAALRLVDTALHELHGAATGLDRGTPAPSAVSGPRGAAGEVTGLHEMLNRASVDVVALLHALRECRAILAAHPQLLPKSLASLDDHLDVAHGAHVGERVAADGDDVGHQPLA